MEFLIKDIRGKGSEFDSPLYWDALKGMCKGKRGFVIGNGPSLKIEDLSKLSGEITIASNRIYLAYNKTDWRPTFYTVADRLLMEKTKDEIARNISLIHAPISSSNLFECSNIRYWLDLGGITADPMKNPTASDDIAYGAYAGHSITFFNLELAFHLGLDPIYIIGCDHNYKGEKNVISDQKIKEKSGKNHFIDGYRKVGEIVNPAAIDNMTHAYEHIREFAKLKNITVQNATRGGKLEVFNRTDFDNLEINDNSISQPLVSICMPNFNGIQFIEETLKSLNNQKYQNVEIIIRDGHSDDGSWEIIQKFSQENERVFIEQIPRKGIYDALNQCINAAKGKYIYILMSDDLIEENTLKEMVHTLESNPDSDICQCRLRVIDEKGDLHQTNVWQRREFPKFIKDFINKKHKRLAPFDALSMFALGTVYTSLTQILVRKSLYEKAGLFSTNFGQYGDFEWQFRASLYSSVIFLPQDLAIWRIHPQQASLQKTHYNARKKGIFSEIAKDQVQPLKKLFPSFYQTTLNTGLHTNYLDDTMRLQEDERNFITKFIHELKRIIFKNKSLGPRRIYEDPDLMTSIAKRMKLFDLIYIIKD
ncbi:hypothetical protein BVX94_00790 [bacterium B17]|nr:hypothetical protein BVX94_00790 [bacterium B17]